MSDDRPDTSPTADLGLQLAQLAHLHGQGVCSQMKEFSAAKQRIINEKPTQQTAEPPALKPTPVLSDGENKRGTRADELKAENAELRKRGLDLSSKDTGTGPKTRQQISKEQATPSASQTASAKFGWPMNLGLIAGAILFTVSADRWPDPASSEDFIGSLIDGVMGWGAWWGNLFVSESRSAEDANVSGIGERPVFTLKEAVEACQVSLKTIRRRRDKGDFPNSYRSATRAQSPWLIPVTDLIAAGLTPGKPAPPEEPPGLAEPS